MEGKEMMKIYSDYPVLVDLIKLREDPRSTSAMKDQILMLEQGLQFLVIYDGILPLFDQGVRPEGKYLNFGEISRVDETLQKNGVLEKGVLAMESGEFKDWDSLASELLGEINSYKPSIREDCSFFSDGLYNGCWFSIDFLMKFMSYADASMANVLHLKGDHIVPNEKMKFESLKEKLDMFRMVFYYVKESNTSYSDFECALNAWVCNVAYLCLLYWVLDENMGSQGNLMLSKLYRNFDVPHHEVTKYCVDYLDYKKIPLEERCKVGAVVSPDVTTMCLSYLKAVQLLTDKRQEARGIVLRFVQSLHCNLKVYLSEEANEMIRDGMMFLIAFVMDPPAAEENEEQPFLNQAQEALKVVGPLIISLISNERDEASIVKATNFLLHDFCEMVITIKAEVRKTYSHLFLDFSFNFPRFNVVNLFDSSIENLKEFPSQFLNQYPILSIEKGLVILRDLLKASNLKDSFLLELQNEQMKSKDLWTRISNLAHQVDRIIRSNACQDGLGLDIPFFLDVQEEIKLLLPKVKRIKDKHMQDSYTCRGEMHSNHIVPFKFDVQEMGDVVVGFEGKVNDIRDWLTHGSENLDIISIIGMGGLGKTTLARKVYNDPFIKSHFRTCAWCIVSQSYDSKKLLLDILKDVIEVNDNFTEMEEEDLADKLRKSLMGKRYLIVMDDIWDVGAWNALKLSFPDDKNYSRVLFTSRIHNVVLDAKFNSYPYPLSQLSNQESWELLERRLFKYKDLCPKKFLQIGKQISIDCKGLPLALVLVVGLLKKKINNLDWWKEIGESLDSRISNEGCANILQLSYKHLSEPLKVCFLYLGLFQEDKVIQVQKLVNLWVAEGFIQKKEMKDVDILAKEYLMDLIGRSLLIVSAKSSSGGIKECHIHDLLREFCLVKSKEEHFFNLLHKKYVSDHSTVDKQYRVSIETEQWKHFFVRKSSPLYSISICPTRSTSKGIDRLPISFCNARFLHVFRTSKGIDRFPISFCNARFLHVLDLEEVVFVGDFPEKITTLIFLRYLAIWCTTNYIPKRIAMLGKLETFRIIRREVIHLPDEILRMESLRHVHIGNLLPPDLSYTILPMQNLVSFSTPCLTYGENAETFLSKLHTIQKLKCQFYSYRQNQMIKLDFLNKLESLNLAHNGFPRLSKFIFILPQNIKKLTLSKFWLPWSEISRIAELQNLEVLKLLTNTCLGKCWIMEAEVFKRLKYLKLQGLNIQNWSASYENFPSLEQIVVEQCHKLEEIPFDFAEISTLREIHIRRCHSSLVKSAKEILNEQIELGN